MDFIIIPINYCYHNDRGETKKGSAYGGVVFFFGQGLDACTMMMSLFVDLKSKNFGNQDE